MNKLVSDMLNKVDKVKILDDMDKNRKDYVKSWEIDSLHFYNLGYYNWMLDNIPKSNIILEIGCGVGFSTLAMLKKGSKVVSIEENIYCVKATVQLLIDNGFKVCIINQREQLKAHSKYQYSIDYNPLEIEFNPSEYDAFIINGDIINDNKFTEWVKSQEKLKIDVITCWLLGTHNSRGWNAIFDLNTIKNSSHAKLFTQNRIYELADEILESDSYLHIVDRVIDVPHIDLIKNTRINHEDQASVTSLKILDINTIEYIEPKGGMGMRVREVTSDSKVIERGKDFEENSRLFISILAQK